MYHLNIPDVTCGHCAGAVGKAVKSVDPNAKVAVDRCQDRIDRLWPPTLLFLRSRKRDTRRPLRSPAAATWLEA